MLVSVLAPLLTSPVSSGPVGDADGLPLPLSVGVAVGVGVVVGVGEMVGVGDEAPMVGDAGVLGEPLDVSGLGVTDGVDVVQVGVGVGVGDGRADEVRLRASSSACASLAETTEVAVSVTGVTAGADEPAAALVTAVVTAAVQVADVVGRGDAAPLDEVEPVPWVGP